MFTAVMVAVLCLAGGVGGWHSAKPLKREQDEFDLRWASRRGGGGGATSDTTDDARKR